MKISYPCVRLAQCDEADAASISLVEIGPREVKRTLEAIPMRLNLDFNADGELVSIEFLDTKLIPRNLLSANESEDA